MAINSLDRQEAGEPPALPVLLLLWWCFGAGEPTALPVLLLLWWCFGAGEPPALPVLLLLWCFWCGRAARAHGFVGVGRLCNRRCSCRRAGDCD